jgi:C4-dicarboxylate transporter DctQ subunit
MEKIFVYIRKIELFLTGIVFVSALAVLSVNIILRQFFSSGLEWAEEYMRYAVIWVTFIGCAICAEDDLHVGIDIIFQISPPKVKKILKIICMSLSTVFCVMFVQFSIRNTALLYNTMQRSPVMLLPMWIIYVSMPLGSMLSALQYGMKTIFSVLKKTEGYADKPQGDGKIDILELN